LTKYAKTRENQKEQEKKYDRETASHFQQVFISLTSSMPHHTLSTGASGYLDLII
jgi:hypothetical protein